MRAQNLETSFCNIIIIINNEFALCDQKAQVLFSLTVILDIKSAVSGKLKTANFSNLPMDGLLKFKSVV